MVKMQKRKFISQIMKFYITNFLKHQTYFFPIVVLFYQANFLTYTQIFWLYSIKSIVFVLLEIPSGIIADRVGRNKSNIFARFMTIPALAAFYFADTFWMFVAANLLMNIGDVFKSGTHKAIIYDYLQIHPEIKKSYSQVIGDTKVWSRVGEGVASLVGAALAVAIGFRGVFAISLIPAVLNFINALSYEKLPNDKAESKADHGLQDYFFHFKSSFIFLKKNPSLVFLMLNSSIIFFSWSVSTIVLQPYMQKVGLSVKDFGVVYFCFLFIAALASKYAYSIGKFFGSNKAMNYCGWLMILPFFILSQKIGVVLFLLSFAIINFVKSAYHPVMVQVVAEKVEQDKRATMLSIAAMFGSIFYLVTLPLTGYILDISNFYTIMTITAVILIINQLIYNIFSFKNNKYENN